MNVFKPIDFDAVRSQCPAWIYKRFNMTQIPTGYLIVPIDYGFTYILRSIRTKWSWDQPDGGQILPELTIEAIQGTSDRPLQNSSYPARLISTPAEVGVFQWGCPSPVDNENFSQAFTATPVKNNIILNYYYQHRERVEFRIHLSNNANIAGQNLVDLLLIGYYMPDEELEQWGEFKELKKG